jgi:hypothetical protein
VKLVVDQFVPADVVYGVATRPGGGAEMLGSEMVGASSKLIPRSPRMYQLEPASNTVVPWLAGVVSGGAVPNRSAAEAGQAATVSPAQARDLRTFIGHPRIAAPTQETATLQENLAANT